MYEGHYAPLLRYCRLCFMSFMLGMPDVKARQLRVQTSMCLHVSIHHAAQFGFPRMCSQFPSLSVLLNSDTTATNLTRQGEGLRRRLELGVKGPV